MHEYYKIIDTNEVSRMDLNVGGLETYNAKTKEWERDFDKVRMFIGELEGIKITQEEAERLISEM